MQIHLEFSTVKYNIFFWLSRISIFSVFLWLILYYGFRPYHPFLVLMACSVLLWAVSFICPWYYVTGKLVIFGNVIHIVSKKGTIEKTYDCNDIKSIRFSFGDYKEMAGISGRFLGNGDRKKGAGNYLVLDNDPGKTFQFFIKDIKTYELLNNILTELRNNGKEINISGSNMFLWQQFTKKISDMK